MFNKNKVNVYDWLIFYDLCYFNLIIFCLKYIRWLVFIWMEWEKNWFENVNLYINYVIMCRKLFDFNWW